MKFKHHHLASRIRLAWLFCCLSCFGCPSHNAPLDAQFNRATQSLSNRDFQEARSHLEQAEAYAHSAHEKSEIQYRKAEVYREEGRLSQAADTFILAADTSENIYRKARAHLEVAHIWAKLGEFEKANAQYKKVYTLYPETGSALRAAKERVSRLSSHKLTAHPLSPTSIWRVIVSECRSPLFCEESQYALARSLEDDCKTQLATCSPELVEIYQRLEQNPTSPRAPLLDDIRIRLAMIQREKGQHAEAIKLLRQGSRKPKSSWFVGTYDTASGAEAYYLLAETLFYYGQEIDEAIKIWSNLGQRFPHSYLLGPALYQATQASLAPKAHTLACEFTKRVPPEYQRWTNCLASVCNDSPASKSCQKRPARLRGQSPARP